MSEYRERVYYLLQAYTGHTATDAEEQELFQWVVNSPDDFILRDYVEELTGHPASQGGLSGEDWENVFRQIRQRIKHEERDQTVIRRLRRYRAAAAILALTIACGSAYFLTHKRHSPANLVAVKMSLHKNDIPPGSEKSILQAGNMQIALGEKDTSFALAGNTIHIISGNLKTADINPTWYALITPRGGEYRLVLADGTTAWLNAGSKLQYPSVFTGSSREVTLEGEAYFEVAQDAAHPFIVHTARQNIRVLGTEFNVHAYPDEQHTVTTLVQGKVEVNAFGKTLVLGPGQQAQVDKEGELSLSPDPDVEAAIAWKNGYFRFDKADIHIVMMQLSRWYDAEVSYEGKVPQQHFGAIIRRNNNISQVLGMLEATGEVHFKVEGRKITVMP